ncbi:cytochrome P450 9e2-like [Agrilus planipennis]|uniref:Cytochrome P450 9e2-like n=1 Tax=Agrilus planipennis TaxID=224129 RepID=A0A1W4XTT6_AGRPL|nr:cytochrome P450 9e2-like [Agrilus planipennis]
MFLLIIAAVFALFLYFLYFKPLWHWKSKDVPFTNPVPVFGNMGKAIFRKEHMMTIVKNIYDKFPDSPCVGFINFQQPILIIRDPELIRKIAIKDFDVFPGHNAIASDDVDPLLSKNLFSIQDTQRWRHLRSTLSPSFTANKLRLMFDLMQECAKNFANYYLQQNDEVIEVDMKDACGRFATDVIATSAFGIKNDSLQNRNNEFYLMGKDFIDFTGLRAIKLFLFGSAPKLMKILRIGIFNKEVTDFFQNIVSGNIKMREEQNIVRPDMINLLLEARKGKSKNENTDPADAEAEAFESEEESERTQKDATWQMEITDQDITAQALIFFLGGFETTSTIMSFAFAELAVNPNVQKKLNEEINGVFERTGGKVKYEDIQQMKYMDMVTSETLRKWSGLTDRKAVKSYTIYQGNGKQPLKVEKDDMIWIPMYAIHRDSKYYPDPEIFDPERFSDERKHEIKPFTYLPFGTGPRNCIGMRFALLEVKIALFNILLHFEVVPTGKVKIPLQLDKAQFSPYLDGGFIFGLKKKKAKDKKL